jgi:hypothetical protein
MHTISREYPNKYSNIIKAQKLKRIMEDTMKIMGWEEMPKSKEKSKRKNTQHAMIKCKDVCMAEKEKQVLNL